MAQTSFASSLLRPDRPSDGSVTVAGITLHADCAGALYWPEERLLIVADLHLEKGSAFAKRGVLLPPYDTASTLGRSVKGSAPSRLLCSAALRWVRSSPTGCSSGKAPRFA